MVSVPCHISVWKCEAETYPIESQLLDVAARFDDDAPCYGWNNETYFSTPPWRNPAWRLGPGRYLARVEVTSSGQKCVGIFRLINDVARSDFRLEAPTAEDLQRLRSTV